MSYSQDLISQAKVLASAERRRPKQASVRRAVSAAYYALFHAIVARAVSAVLLGADAAGPIGNRVRRTVSHGSALRAAKWFAGTAGSMPAAVRAMRPLPQSPVTGSLAQVCQLFVDLQSERHRADYDLSAPFTRAETSRRITDAESAMAALDSLQTGGDALIFLLCCVIGENLTKNA